MGDGKYKDGNPPSRLALYLSALVFPGAGQYAQKRWLAGSFYAAFFLVCVVFLFTAIWTPLFWNLRMMAEFSGKPETLVLRPIAWMQVLFWFSLSIVFYLGGLLDTFICYRRRPKQD
ncbi:MAG: hypothetical protein Q7J98_13275 [Kiritimatiellia bacterium]|nr:hypothetical protein [Kiritimatiellia bacterium]